MAFEPINALEHSLIKAAKDPAHRPQFYRDFLAADIFVIQHGPPPRVTENRLINAGETLQLTTWQQEGKTVLPVFSSVLRLQNYVQEEVGYLAMNAAALLEIVKGSALILNPGADYGKEFKVEEVAAMVDGSLWKPTERFVTQKETKVLIGQPANYPHDLAAALTRYFQNSGEVQYAYLAHFFNPERDAKPHTLIAMRVTGDWDQIASGAGLIARDIAIPDPPVDFMQITGKGGIEEHFKTGFKPFFEKKKILGIF